MITVYWHTLVLLVVLGAIAYKGVKSYKRNALGGGVLDLSWYSALPWTLLFVLTIIVYVWIFW